MKRKRIKNYFSFSFLFAPSGFRDGLVQSLISILSFVFTSNNFRAIVYIRLDVLFFKEVCRCIEGSSSVGLDYTKKKVLCYCH